jgi:hypothetical protein
MNPYYYIAFHISPYRGLIYSHDKLDVMDRYLYNFGWWDESYILMVARDGSSVTKIEG